MDRYFYNRLRLVIFPVFLFLGWSVVSHTQPVIINTNLVDGETANDYLLTDKGMYRQKILRASTNHSNGMWQFPKNSGNMTEVWRPDNPGLMIAGFNQIVDPNLTSASARYHTDGGGYQGLIPAVTAGKYYTINVSEQTPSNSQYMAIMETDTVPVKIESVSNPEIATADLPTTITIEMDTFPSSNEVFYIRYSTDNLITSDTVRLSITGKNGEGQIPGFPAGTDVTYYVFSTVEGIEFHAINSMWINIGTLNFNNNNGLYYSYLTEAALPVVLTNLSSKRKDKQIVINWSTSIEANNDFYTIERFMDNVWREIGTVNALYGRSNQNFNYEFIDESPITGFNIYRLSQTDNDGTSQLLGDTRTYYAGIDVQIFPNPATDIIYIAGHNLPDHSNLILKDIIGRDLTNIRNNGRLNAMDISKYPKGVYQLILTDADQNILTVQRVIKQ